MKLFTVGPVEMYEQTKNIYGYQEPYFRTSDFSSIMKENEKMFLKSVNAPDNSCFISLTTSGTGMMDAMVANLITDKDYVLIINGGTFGKRFADICTRYNIRYDTYDIPYFESFDKMKFDNYSNKGYTVLLVNACETSSGQKYDLNYLGNFCKKNNMLFIVDAISAYLADQIDMTLWNIDAVFTASQKALALASGVSLAAISNKCVQRLKKSRTPLYFDFNEYIENQKRGQPPFTCAVNTMIALNCRLKYVTEKGIHEINKDHSTKAHHFRNIVSHLPIVIPNIPLSNCCTPLLFKDNNAEQVFNTLKDKYGIYLTPSGGDLKHRQLRVGHMGNITISDLDELVSILRKGLTI